jgi:hypothetical protein
MATTKLGLPSNSEFQSRDVNGGTNQLQTAVPETAVKILLRQYDQSQRQSQSYNTIDGLLPVSLFCP